MPNLRGTLAAIEPLKNADNQELMTRYGVFSKSELDSRYEISLEEYFRKLRIECGIAIEIARSMILGAAADEYIRLGNALACSGQNGVSGGRSALKNAAEKLGSAIDDLACACDKLENAMNNDDAALLEELLHLRSASDRLEYLVDDRLWPLPKYREMLFIY